MRNYFSGKTIIEKYFEKTTVYSWLVRLFPVPLLSSVPSETNKPALCSLWPHI